MMWEDDIIEYLTSASDKDDYSYVYEEVYQTEEKKEKETEKK